MNENEEDDEGGEVEGQKGWFAVIKSTLVKYLGFSRESSM
jgi:hypothetical protein